MTIMAPTIAPAARDLMAAEIALSGGVIECSFSCQYDETTRTITNARLMARGTRSSAPVILGDLKPGSVCLHNHVDGRLELSDLDVTALHTLADRGIGFGVINNDATALCLSREPIPHWQFLEPRPTTRVRSWTFGPFALFYSPRRSAGTTPSTAPTRTL